jgi:hypothetical protein
VNNPRPYRSFFWPMALIGVGVIWLLFTLGIIQPANINTLASFWPLLLIFIGLDVIFGRRSPLIGGGLALLAILAVAGILIAGPRLNLPGGTAATMQTRTINEPVGSATDATINMDFSFLPVKVHTVSDKTNLMEGQIQYYGGISYSSSGNPTRRISLSPAGSINFFINPDQSARWDIGLNPALPLDLRLNGASGSVDLNLASLQLSALTFDQGSGSAEIALPPSETVYPVEIRGASGSLNLTLSNKANVILHLNGSSGSINIHVPNGAAVSLEVVHSGSGSVNVPAGYKRISTGENNKVGVWQSPGYNTSKNQISIICDSLASGSFNID